MDEGSGTETEYVAFVELVLQQQANRRSHHHRQHDRLHATVEGEAQVLCSNIGAGGECSENRVL